MHPADQTIFALSSGRAPSAIAVVRISGPGAGEVLRLLAGKLPKPRQAMRAWLRAKDQSLIDDAVVLWFPGPASATGQDVAELHVHGGRAVLAALFVVLSDIADLRLAEPGEFTRRAFENGKLDLTEAEALDDLIHADTDRQRRQAVRQLNGLLGDKARDWRRRLIEATALIEAGIDFADERDVPTELLSSAVRQAKSLLSEIEEVLGARARSERLRDGLVVAIAGPPNVGKSTLMNQLARREVAIVSPYAGTTRDVIEVHLDLDGYPVTLIDTAGIRATEDPVEQEGIRRAEARAADADLVLWLTDARDPATHYQGTAPVWTVRNKVDLMGEGAGSEVAGAGFAISAVSGDGVAKLVEAIAAYAREFFGAEETGMIGRLRHRQLLEQAAELLHRSIELAEEGAGEELVAEELRLAGRTVGRLLGRVDIEDILDVIFREFCIGK